MIHLIFLIILILILLLLRVNKLPKINLKVYPLKLVQAPQVLIRTQIPQNLRCNFINSRVNTRDLKHLISTCISRGKKKSTVPTHAPISETVTSNGNINPSLDAKSDLDLPTAIKKGITICTQQPISNFMSLERLS